MFDGVLPVEPPEVRLLRFARDRLDRPGGWCQGELERQLPDMTMAFCLMGALHDARQANPDLGKAWDSVMSLICAHTASNISSWNDQRGRTQSDVLDALDRTIATALARASVHA